MSISSLFAPNPYTIYAKTFVPGTPGVAGRVAFFDSLGALASSNIEVTGLDDNLTFLNNKTIYVDNIESTDGDLNLGNGVTNLLTLNSLNQTTIDAVNNITIGHVGLAVDIPGDVTTPNIITTDIESLTTLVIGATSTDVTLDAITNLTIGHAGGTITLLDTVQVDNLSCLTINSPTTLDVGSTTPTLILDATTAMTISHPGVPVVIDDSVEVDNIDTINIDSSTPNLNIGVTTTNVLVDAATTLSLGHSGGNISVISAVTAPNILSLDATASIVIGNSTTTAISIGHVGITTAVTGIANFLGGLTTNFVQSATGVAMVIGNAATALALTPSSGLIHLDQISTGAAITIGDVFATAVNLGRAAITTTINGIADIASIDRAGAIAIGGTSATSLALGRAAITTTILGASVLNSTLLFNQASATTLGFYAEAANMNVTATGPVASQIVGNLGLQRVGNTVTLSLDWTAAPVVTVPATAIFTFDVAIPAIYRPANTLTYICRVFAAGVAAQGSFQITAAGVMTVFPTAGGVWTIGQTAAVDSVSVSYNIAI